MGKRIFSLTGLILTVVLAVAVAAPETRAQKSGISLIRDAEIEHIIRRYSTPLFQAAGLDAEAVHIHIVQDASLNAFVAGGQRIFITTGLLMRSENPNQLMGVIAHETGHIAGGHLARTHDALRSASAQAIAAFVLGAAAAAAGAPQAGMAIVSGGQHIAQRSMLQYSRTQESAADHAALTYLESAGISPIGLLRFLKILGDQEALLISMQDPYTRTHPISHERIRGLEEQVQQSKTKQRPDPAALVELHARMRAKLIGYLEPLATTLREYPESDTSTQARYARAFAHYRVADVPRALSAIKALLTERPEDPFFLELKGQILFEHGRAAEAVAPYRAAMKAAPGEPLLRLGLAQSLLGTDEPMALHEAIRLLDIVVRAEPDNSFAWHQLAVAHGRDGNLGMASLASAERFMLQGNRRDARGQAERAMRILPQGSPGWIRAQDITNMASRRDDGTR